jgi:hypothetical protein
MTTISKHHNTMAMHSIHWFANTVKPVKYKDTLGTNRKCPYVKGVLISGCTNISFKSGFGTTKSVQNVLILQGCNTKVSQYQQSIKYKQVKSNQTLVLVNVFVIR